MGLTMGVIDDNLKHVSSRIEAACSRYDRQPEEITLVGVSKTKGFELVEEAWRAGLVHFGENKVQEAESKIPDVGEGPVWHFIGHLQTNKTKKAIRLFDIIESVDSLKIARALSKECSNHETEMEILLEVNSSGEASKYGLSPDNVMPVAEEVSEFDNLRLGGLMTVGPFTEDEELIDKSFISTENLFKRMRDRFGETIKTLSMGMTSDFERAIKFGSTELRIGTAIFGARDYLKK
ncbi:MAG: YggS family pyridoxal phosphate-dependent enzyme [candidate division Zixibacteria bacterium]|nr:YggS family pyridoxal phosphate-dependent enzyme [candidate division Zixibacteria bacterium]